MSKVSVPDKFFVTSDSESSAEFENSDFQSAEMSKSSRYFVDLFVKLPLVLIIFTILLPILLILRIINLFKYLVYLVLRKLNSKKNEKIYSMSGYDTMFYYGTHESDKSNDSIILATLYLRKELKKEKLDKILEKLKKFPRLISIPQSSYFGFTEFVQYQNMNISDHTREYYVSHHQLHDEIEKMRKKKMNKNIPWWDVTILNINKNVTKEDDYESVVIIRFHHIIGDGISVISNIIPILFTNSNNKPIELNWNRKWTRSTKHFGIESLCLLIEALWKSVSSGSISDTQIYKNKPKCPINEKYYSQTMPIDLVKKIKKIEKCSFTAVVISAFAGALRRFSIENEHFSTNQINLGNFRFLMVIGYPSLGKLGNNFCSISTPFYINIKDSFKRLKFTENAMNKIKNGFDPYIGLFMPNIFGCIKPSVTRKMSQSIFEKHTTPISSLPIMSVKPAYFGDVEIMNIEAHVQNFVQPFPEIITFQDKLTINMASDESFYPQIQQICSYFQMELENMNKNLSDITHIREKKNL